MAKAPKTKKRTLFHKIRDDDLLKWSGGFLSEHWLALIATLLVLVGLILELFYNHVGDALVGLGFGIYFFPELHRCFSRLKDLYVEGGVFKTLLTLGVFLYLLIAIPAFVIAAAVGYALIALASKKNSKKK